jgi:outer membrane protein OmpA-like peptidoglycan-associated protein
MKSKLLYLLLCLFIFGFQAEMYAQFNAVKTPEKLGGTVNTEAEESMPIFDKESSTLFFVRSSDENSIGGKNDQDVWKSEKEEDFSYSKGASVKELNNKYNNAIVGINKAGDHVYLLNSYEGKKDLKKGISLSEYKRKKWGKAKELRIPKLDIDGDFYGFHINEDENAIILSFYGPNSEGEEDLYVSTKNSHGKWTEPIHMGSQLNSSGYEISPFLSPNNDTLFFSSNGMGGQGDADIFYSIRAGESWSSWSNPINIGTKINSPKFDAYFIYSGKNYYWSSNREAIRADIYYATEIPPLNGKIRSTDVTVYKGSDGLVQSTPIGGIAPYTFLWKSGEKSEGLDLVPKGIYTVTITDSYGQQVTLEATVNEPAPIITTHVSYPEAIIYFDRQSSYLNPQNKKELEAFLVQLKDLDTTLKFEVISHCDSRSSDEYNMWLGERRMTRTIDFLVAKGIDKSRFLGDFKGETQPDVKCETCTEPQFTLNRRTTIKVIRP